jgi:hypothetical protein
LDAPKQFKDLAWVFLWQSASLVADTLEPLIKEMAPEMDQSERLTRIYGDPGDGD